MINQITKIIKALVSDFPDNEIELFIDICKSSIIKQNDYFIQAGQTPRKFGIITKGIVRYFYNANNGKEFTKAFLTENSFISSYSAMKNNIPSLFSIQAITYTEIIEIDYNKWEILRQKNQVWNKLLIALLETGYAIKEKRERELLFLDAESRYKIFCEEFSVSEKNIKQHLIASYIGITPIALSRIRKKNV